MSCSLSIHLRFMPKSVHTLAYCNMNSSCSELLSFFVWLWPHRILAACPTQTKSGQKPKIAKRKNLHQPEWLSCTWDFDWPGMSKEQTSGNPHRKRIELVTASQVFCIIQELAKEVKSLSAGRLAAQVVAWAAGMDWATQASGIIFSQCLRKAGH